MLRIRPRTFFLILCSALTALLILAPLLGVRLYRNPTSSMDPTMLPNETVLTAPFGKSADQLPLGTLVIYDVSKVSRSLRGDHLKRLAAKPGDRIEVVGNELRLNGGPFPMIDGQYPGPVKAVGGSVSYPLVVPSGHVFVLGDNYGNSLDSRYFGPIPAEAVTKTVRFRTSPLSRFGRVE